MVLGKRSILVLSGLVSGLLLSLIVLFVSSPSDTLDLASVQAFKEEAARCYEDKNPPQCYNELVISKAPVYGVEASVRGFMEFIDADNGTIKEQCHRSAHYLGEYAGETIPVVDDALAAGGSFCQFGYYHGVIEGYARVSNKLWEELPHLCGKITKDTGSTVYGECVHSLGHAVVTRTKYDIPKGLDRCLLLPTYRERTSCGTGIFMSWSNELDRKINSGKSLSAEFTQVPKDSRWDMCPSVPEGMTEPCVQFFAETTSMTIEGLLKYVKWCEAEFPSRPEVISSCYRGIGRVSGGEAGFAKVGGWPGVIALCTDNESQVHVDECTSAAYSTASGFFAGKDMYTPACAAWGSDPRKEVQCGYIKSIYEQVNKQVVIGE